MQAEIRYLAKQTVAAVLYYTGLLWLYARFRLRGKVVVLMYHRVLSEDERRETFSHPGIVIGETALDRQLGFLKKHFRMLSGTEFVERLRGGKPDQRPACLVTFDDGWIDNYTRAFPLLRKHATPAVIFLATGLIGSPVGMQREQFAARLYGVYESRDQQALDQLLEPELHGLTDLDPEDARSQIHLFLTGRKRRSEADNADLLRRIEQTTAVGTAATVDRFMDWEQVREMSVENIVFGGHTVSHASLTVVPAHRVTEEVTLSREALIEHLSASPALFAYPSGDFNAVAIQAVKTAGFRCAFATHHGYVSPGDDPWSLPRINIHGKDTTGMPIFLCRILGIL